jgi:protein phosphatase PTC7
MAQALRALNTSLYVNVGTAKLPHPFKTPTGVAGNKRIHGAAEYATDVDLSEDAEFIWQGPTAAGEGGPGNGQEPKPYTWAGVADGVGSWREYGVDPREFSRALMEGCVDALRSASEPHSRPPRPEELLASAHSRAQEMGVVGSSTACVMLFDGAAHQVHFSNLGDSGIIVLRHIDSSVAGVLKRDRVLKREGKRGSDLRVSFVSQQQLKSFNHPYQFGWLGKENEEDSSNR